MDPELPSELRVRSVKPRRAGYVHRQIIVALEGFGVLETGEPVANLHTFAASMESHIWVTSDPAALLEHMLVAFEDEPHFNYQIVSSRDDSEGPVFETTRLTRFGFRCDCDDDTRETCPYRKHRAMHIVWSPRDMMRDPTRSVQAHTVPNLLRFASDVRAFCHEQGLPIPTTLPGIASSLLRDERFWPEDRGRVPRATNDRLRPLLPGVYSELRAKTGQHYQAVGLDQRTAYHRAAQETPTPDPTTLFARGYFSNPDEAPIWCSPGDVLYDRIVGQPGVVCATVSVRPLRKGEVRPPALTPGRHRIYIWTNELPYCETHGMQVHALHAAWTSNLMDDGLPRYGAYAETQIRAADDYRKVWLKPTLHAAYGLLGARPRNLSIGHYRGKGNPAVRLLGLGHEFLVHERQLGSLQSATVNVAMLGTLQAEIRLRSFKMATALMSEGVEVLHIHADGIHVHGALPLLDDSWSIKPLDNLTYLDRVSWLSDQGDILPGRDRKDRADERRHRADMLALMPPQSGTPWLSNKLTVIYHDPRPDDSERPEWWKPTPVPSESEPAK